MSAMSDREPFARVEHNPRDHAVRVANSVVYSSTDPILANSTAHLLNAAVAQRERAAKAEAVNAIALILPFASEAQRAWLRETATNLDAISASRVERAAAAKALREAAKKWPKGRGRFDSGDFGAWLEAEAASIEKGEA